jgi:hypothetical protein
MLKDEWLMKNYDFEYLGIVGRPLATHSEGNQPKRQINHRHQRPAARNSRYGSLGDHQRREEDLAVSGPRVSKPSCEVVSSLGEHSSR